MTLRTLSAECPITPRRGRICRSNGGPHCDPSDPRIWTAVEPSSGNTVFFADVPRQALSKELSDLWFATQCLHHIRRLLLYPGMRHRVFHSAWLLIPIMAKPMILTHPRSETMVDRITVPAMLIILLALCWHKLCINQKMGVRHRHTGDVAPELAISL